jgi:hypothetical protein
VERVAGCFSGPSSVLEVAVGLSGRPARRHEQQAAAAQRTTRPRRFPFRHMMACPSDTLNPRRTKPRRPQLEIAGLLRSVYGLDVERVNTINYEVRAAAPPCMPALPHACTRR